MTDERAKAIKLARRNVTKARMKFWKFEEPEYALEVEAYEKQLTDLCNSDSMRYYR